MSAKKLDPQQALIKALGHPQRKELLRLCLEAEEPRSPKELALATHRGKRSFQAHLSNVSYHMRVLAQYGALVIVEEEPRRGSVAHFYRPTELVRETPWVLGALRLPPLSEEERAHIDAHIAERRNDKEFMARLKQRGEKLDQGQRRR